MRAHIVNKPLFSRYDTLKVKEYIFEVSQYVGDTGIFSSITRPALMLGEYNSIEKKPFEKKDILMS